MAARDIRKKASDIFREGYFPFVQKVGFEEAYPQIDDLTIEVEEWGYSSKGKRVYRKPNLPGEYVDCSNPLCYKGGVSIGLILRRMVREGATDRDETALCQGNEGSPKGRRIYRKCLHSFEIHISLTYKTPSAPGSTTP
jgi:hypothetical protein